MGVFTRLREVRAAARAPPQGGDDRCDQPEGASHGLQAAGKRMISGASRTGSAAPHDTTAAQRPSSRRLPSPLPSSSGSDQRGTALAFGLSDESRFGVLCRSRVILVGHVTPPRLRSAIVAGARKTSGQSSSSNPPRPFGYKDGRDVGRNRASGIKILIPVSIGGPRPMKMSTMSTLWRYDDRALSRPSYGKTLWLAPMNFEQNSRKILFHLSVPNRLKAECPCRSDELEVGCFGRREHRHMRP